MHARCVRWALMKPCEMQAVKMAISFVSAILNLNLLIKISRVEIFFIVQQEIQVVFNWYFMLFLRMI